MTFAKMQERITESMKAIIVILLTVGLAFSAVVVGLHDKAEALTSDIGLLNADNPEWNWCHNAVDIPQNEGFYKGEVSKKGSWKTWTVAKGTWDQNKYPNSVLKELKVQLGGSRYSSSALWIYNRKKTETPNPRYTRISAAEYFTSLDSDGYTKVTFRTPLSKVIDNQDIYVAVNGKNKCGSDQKVNMYGPVGEPPLVESPTNPVDPDESPIKSRVEVHLDDDAYGARQCTDLRNKTTQRLFKFWNDRSSNEIDVIKVTYASAIPSEFNDSAVSIRYSYANYTAGRDFDVATSGTDIYLKFRQPLVYNTGGQLWIDMPGMAGKSCPQVSAWSGVDNPSNSNKVCKSTFHPEDPSSVNLSKTGRQSARELSPQETSEGSRTYVITSEPKDASRYKSQLWYQPAGGEPYVRIGAETGWVYNALAYNPTDNWLYAISQIRKGTGDEQQKEDSCFPSGYLLQINPLTGEVYNLGFVAKAPGGKTSPFANNDRYGGINAGVIMPDGAYIVSNSSLSGTRSLYKVNIPEVGNSNASATITGLKSYSEDYAVIAQADNYIWGIRSAASGNADQLERIDIRTRNVATLNISSLVTESGAVFPRGKNWGKSWTYGNGNLGFGTGSSGANTTSIQLKIIDPAATLTLENVKLIAVNNDAPASYNTDGASYLGSPVNPDLSVKKVLGSVEGGRISWNIRVTNNGAGGSSGFVLNDNLPAGYTISNIKNDITVIDTTPDTNRRDVDYNVSKNLGSQGNDQIQILVGSVPEGHEVTIKVVATLPIGKAEQCVANTVMITPNESDPIVENNTSTADCGLEFEKNAIDIDGTHRGIDFEDSEVIKNLGGVDYRTVRFDLIAKNPGIAKLPYVLTDAPDFTHDVVPKFVIVKEKKSPGDRVSQIGREAQIEYRSEIPVSFIVNRNIRNQTPVPDHPEQIFIEPGERHYFELEYYYSMNPDSKSTETKIWDHLQCVGEKGSRQPGEGLYNKAYLRDVKNQKDIVDEDCVPIDQPKPTPDPFVKLTKVDASDKKTLFQIEKDVKFAVYPFENGKVDRDKPVALTGDRYQVPTGKYAIIETQAPKGFSLLPAPVYFEIEKTKEGHSIHLARWNGEQWEKIEENNDALVELIGKTSGTSNEEDLEFTIQIADVRTGDLPLTGGTGVGINAAIGLFMATLTLYVAKRKTVRA